MSPASSARSELAITLEFIVAMKWPFTVLIVLAFFGVVLWRSPGLRNSLKNKDWRFEAAGMALEARTQDVEQNLAAATPELPMEARRHTDYEVSMGEDDDPFGDMERAEIEAAQREAMERLVQSAATWGYDQAKANRPEPRVSVEWASDGKPVLNYPGRARDVLAAAALADAGRSIFSGDSWHGYIQHLRQEKHRSDAEGDY